MINDMIVGMENLPNIFIDKITIEPNRLDIVLSMYDSSTYSWFNRGLDLKVKFMYETVMENISMLNDGKKSLYEYEPSTLADATLSSLKRQTRVLSCDGFIESETDQPQYKKFTANVNFIIPSNYQNLNIYAACFIDGLGFNNPMFDKFYGPMAAERVLISGEINQTTNYFYYPDSNEEYGGPVHKKPNGDYMEGSVHTEEPHKKVIPVFGEQNFKIINNVSDEEQSEPIEESDPPQTFIIDTSLPSFPEYN
tara:strand:+ start:2718 stop:3473 length:756 start_codon:yes stop_codon:yes gene_type:complete